jgi:uncharacterized cupin superfamily protein
LDPVTLEAASAVAALSLPLDHEPVPADQVVDGVPSTASAALCAVGDVEIGVWEMTTGAMSDIESDEVFVVISGRATVRFEHDGTLLALGPGTVGRLAAGQRTVWTVTETLRKVYIA